MHAVVSTLLEKGNVNDFDSLFLGVLIKISLQIKKNIYIFSKIVAIVAEELF